MSKKAKGQLEEPPPVQPFDPTVFVQLVSGDGAVFYCDRNCAKISKLVKTCLTQGPPAGCVEAVLQESESGLQRVRFPMLSAPQLENAVRFMHYKYKGDLDAEHRTPFPLPTQPEAQLALLATATMLQL